MFSDVDWTALVLSLVIVTVVLTPAQVWLLARLSRGESDWLDRRAVLVLIVFGAITAALLFVVYRLLTA